MTDEQLVQYLTDNGIDFNMAEAVVEIGQVTDKASADQTISYNVYTE